MYTPTEAQQELFKIAYKAGDRITRAIQTYTKDLVVWLQQQYGETKPTYEQFWSDREALAIIAKEKGLVDDQWVRKPYNAAVRALYGDLPVSPSKAAVAKRQVRASRINNSEHMADRRRPAKKSDPIKNVENAMHRMIEQYGYAAVLTAFSHILAERDETRQEAKRVENLGKKFTTPNGVDNPTPVH